MFNVIVIITVSLIILLNMFFAPVWNTALNLLIAFAIVLLPSLVFLILTRKFPKKWFNWKIFFVSQKEQKLLEKLGIKKWKDYIPDYGNLVNFKKDKLAKNPKDKTYLTKFIEETYYGEITHEMCIISSIISFFFVPHKIKLTMGLPILIAYCIFNIPSILIQRYNRPRFINLLSKISNISTNEVEIEIENKILKNN